MGRCYAARGGWYLLLGYSLNMRYSFLSQYVVNDREVVADIIITVSVVNGPLRA